MISLCAIKLVLILCDHKNSFLWCVPNLVFHIFQYYIDHLCNSVHLPSCQLFPSFLPSTMPRKEKTSLDLSPENYTPDVFEVWQFKTLCLKWELRIDLSNDPFVCFLGYPRKNLDLAQNEYADLVCMMEDWLVKEK